MTEENRPAGRLAGKRALITGAAQGLGRAFAERFVAEGAQVFVTDVQADKVATTAGEIGAKGHLAHDVTDADQWTAAVEAANAAMGGIDTLIHNAGVASWGTIETEDFAQYRRVMAIDCDAVFLGTQAALPVMKECGPGSIVVISSVAGLKAQAHLLAYNTAKAAVAMMTRSIAKHCAQAGYGITANSVHPVFTRTPILDPMLAMRDTPEEGERALTRNIPLGRLGEPEEVASMVTYLASSEARFVTGSAFTIDGGLMA